MQSSLVFIYFNYFFPISAYCKRGEELLQQLSEIVQTSKDLMVEFRAKLAKEEMLSHKIKTDSVRKYK